MGMVVNAGNWGLEKLLGPAYGAIFSPENPPLLLWAPVAGADKYQVGFSTRPYLSTIDKWYDVGDNRWQVPNQVWHDQPEGEFFWTVRTVETSGGAGKPLPMRSIFRSSDGSLTAAHAAPGRTAAGHTLLEWKPVAKRVLYLITVSSDREGVQTIRRYLTSEPKVDLRAVDRRLESGKTYFWRVDAISPAGKLLMSGPPQSFVAEASPKTGYKEQRGELVQLASLGMPASLRMSPLDLTAQITKR